jgi:DNA polymerase III subunit delta
MPRLNPASLLERLRQRPPAAVVFLYGDEDYLREQAGQAVLELFLDSSTRDFNYDQLRGGDASAEGLASLLATPPLLAEHRVVLIREAQHLSPKARTVVESVLARPPSGLVLVLTARIPAGSKAKFYDALRSAALAVEFPALDVADLPGWLVERASSEHGVRLELDAARALGAAIGSDLGVLAVELAKAAAYVADRRQVTLEDVRAVGGYLPRVDRWAWLDRVGEKRFAEALAELPDLLDAGETGVGLVIGVGAHLLRLGILLDGGREALERHLRPNQLWLARRLEPQARRWRSAEIDAALGELLRTDRLLKSASLSDRQAIEELLLRLASLDPAAALAVAAGPMPGRG